MMKVRIKKGVGWNKGMEGKEFRVLTEQEYNQYFSNIPFPLAVYPIEHPENTRGNVKVLKKNYVEIIEEDSILEKFENANGIINHPKGTFIKVDRNPVVGDLILIVKPTFSYGAYQENDILPVDRVGDERVYSKLAEVSGNRAGQIDFNEYVVIEPYNEGIVGQAWKTITKIAEVVGVTGRDLLEAFKAINSLYQEKAIELTPEAPVKPKIEMSDRDKVVEYAREYVKDLMELVPDNQKAKFITNTDKRVIVCLIKGRYLNKVMSRGKAKAAVGDCFNVHIGQAIAISKALDILPPIEFIKAPQPQVMSNGCLISINGSEPLIFGKDIFDFMSEDIIEIVDDSARYPE